MNYHFTANVLSVNVSMYQCHIVCAQAIHSTRQNRTVCTRAVLLFSPVVTMSR